MSQAEEVLKPQAEGFPLLDGVGTVVNTTQGWGRQFNDLHISLENPAFAYSCSFWQAAIQSTLPL